MFWLYLFILYIVFIVYCLWSVTPSNGIKVIDKCSVDTMLITNCLEICHLPFQNQSYFENLFYETDIPSHSSSVRTQTGMHPGKTGKNRGVPGNGSCPWITGTARGGTGTFSQRAPNPGVIKETTTHTHQFNRFTRTHRSTHTSTQETIDGPNIYSEPPAFKDLTPGRLSHRVPPHLGSHSGGEQGGRRSPHKHMGAELWLEGPGTRRPIVAADRLGLDCLVACEAGDSVKVC